MAAVFASRLSFLHGRKNISHSHPEASLESKALNAEGTRFFCSIESASGSSSKESENSLERGWCRKYREAAGKRRKKYGFWSQTDMSVFSVWLCLVPAVFP